MNSTGRAISLLLLPILALSIQACEKLQPGYYLTPENYPTRPITVMLTGEPASPVPPTATPPSTVQVIATATLTPLPSPTPSPTSTETPIPCTETTGRIVLDSFVSQITGREFRFRVYLPPCYTLTGRRYPYLIMMHGLVPGSDIMNDAQWDQLGLDEAADQGYARGVLPPIIIVMPNGNDASYGDDNSPFPDIVQSELIRVIEARFCTWNDSAHRAIGGLSRGAYWAFWIVFSNPRLFDRVGGHSPFLYDAEFASDKNPDNLVDTAPGIERLTMYLDHGAEDYVEAGVQDFVTRLERRGIEPEYIVNPTGGHTEDYWAAHTLEYLLFYTAGWERNVQNFPECQPENGS